MTDFPATRIVHCPSGPVPACDKHAQDITKLFNFMGAHVVHTKANPADQCSNCANEANFLTRTSGDTVDTQMAGFDSPTEAKAVQS